MPAKAGIQVRGQCLRVNDWTPACAGVTVYVKYVVIPKEFIETLPGEAQRIDG